jgi:hypothetical protein
MKPTRAITQGFRICSMSGKHGALLGPALVYVWEN